MAQEEFKGYRIDLQVPNDKVITRDRVGRTTNVLVSSAIIFLVPLLFVRFWGALLGFPSLGLILGVLAGGFAASRIVPNWMVIYNPEWTGYVTNDAFGGGMVAYGPGLHLSHWWETRNTKGNHSLEVITRDFSAHIATKTSQVVIMGKFEYAKNLAHLTLAVGVDESTIESGLTAFIESFLTSRCAVKDAEAVRGMIDVLNKELANSFMEEEQQVGVVKAANPKNFGNKYGFTTVSVVINSIAFPEAVQKTRDSRDEAKQLFIVVAEMYGMTEEELRSSLKDGKVTKTEYDKMLNRAMAASDNAKMTINVVEGAAGGLLTAAAADLAQGGKS